MRNVWIIFFFLGFCIVDSFSQPSTFLKTYSNGNSGYAVREMNGNSYIVAGATDYYYNFNWNMMSAIANTNIHLFKTTEDGTLLWEKIFPMPASRSLATWAELTVDGGIIIAGRSNQDLAWPPDSNDVLLLKCDSDGVIQWSKKYDSGKDELGFCVRQTFDGGYAISAFHDAAPMSLTGTTYAMLIKTDSAGNVLWDKSYEFAVRDLDTGEGLTWVFSQTADSGYVLTGTTVGAHQADLYVIRTDPAGNVIWAKSYEHDNTVNRFSLGLDIIENNSGEIIIAGAMDKDHSLNELNYPYILKLNNSGVILQGIIYNSIPPQAFQSGFSSVEQNPDGGYLFTGMGGYSGFGQQAQILKTDADFNMDWSRSYTWDGIATMGSRSGRSTSDGSYIFTGKKEMAGSVLLKTDFIGLVPCKTPAVLTEITPSILAIDRFPGTINGIIASDILFNTMLSAIDTTTVCPVTFSHLPVELISLSASMVDEKSIILEWETASETNNDYFIVEKSPDGISFSKTGVVKGGGNSTNILYYSFIDTKLPEVEVLYYRLRQVDYDGKEQISKTIAVMDSHVKFKLVSTKSDPLNHKITFYVLTKNIEHINYTLTDVLGKTHLNFSETLQKGVNEIEIEAGNLSQGIYYFVLSNNIQNFSVKIFY